MTRLATNGALREELGRNARVLASPPQASAVEGYRTAIERAIERPIRRVRDLPAHLLADDTDLARRLTSELGVETDLFGECGHERPSPRPV